MLRLRCLSHQVEPPPAALRVSMFDDALCGCIAASGDAAEGDFDREGFEFIGIITIKPFAGVGVIGMAGVVSCVEHLVETADTAAVFGRAVAFTADEARVANAGVAGTDVADGEAVFPIVAKVVGVVDVRCTGAEDLAQAGARGDLTGLGAPVLFDRQPIGLPGDDHFPTDDSRAIPSRSGRYRAGTLSVIEVGTSTTRQMMGLEPFNSIRSVAISVKLSMAFLVVMRPLNTMFFVATKPLPDVVGPGLR